MLFLKNVSPEMIWSFSEVILDKTMCFRLLKVFISFDCNFSRSIHDKIVLGGFFVGDIINFNLDFVLFMWVQNTAIDIGESLLLGPSRSLHEMFVALRVIDYNSKILVGSFCSFLSKIESVLSIWLSLNVKFLVSFGLFSLKARYLILIAHKADGKRCEAIFKFFIGH